MTTTNGDPTMTDRICNNLGTNRQNGNAYFCNLPHGHAGDHAVIRNTPMGNPYTVVFWREGGSVTVVR